MSPGKGAEGRRPTKGNTPQTTTLRTQSRAGVSDSLQRVREAARRDRCAKFTALMHHITVDLLRDNYYALERNADSGVDRVTWQAYGEIRKELLVRRHQPIAVTW